MSEITPCRAAFEKFADMLGLDTLWKDGIYTEQDTYYAWTGWRGAWNEAAKETHQPGEWKPTHENVDGKWVPVLEAAGVNMSSTLCGECGQEIQSMESYQAWHKTKETHQPVDSAALRKIRDALDDFMTLPYTRQYVGTEPHYDTRVSQKTFHNGKEAIALLDSMIEQPPKREISEPTEAMCDRARWFILARDSNIYTWGGLTRCVDKTIPYIEEKMRNDPQGHITKWDFAECVYRLMTTEIEGGES